MKVLCESPGCQGRRKHYESDEPRGPQYVEVPDDYVGKAFCSLECASYAMALKLKTLIEAPYEGDTQPLDPYKAFVEFDKPK